MNGNQTIRLIHRWLSAALMVAMFVNLVAVLMHRYTNTLGLLAALPLVLLFLSGVYLYALHYTAKWRSARRASRTTASVVTAA
jgi:ascorbate-specific PTS system EIIC-type component UlaA